MWVKSRGFVVWVCEFRVGWWRVDFYMEDKEDGFVFGEF